MRKLHDLARGHDQRPWCLTVSFTHPHDPYVVRRRVLGTLRGRPALDPRLPDPGYDAQDPHSRRILDACDWRNVDDPAEDVRRARRGYFASISYVDEKIGEILDGAGGDAAGRGDGRPLHLRPWRHAGRARPVVQDELLRGLGAGAVDDRRARRSRRASSPSPSASSTCCRRCAISPASTPPDSAWTDGESLLPLMAGGARPAPVRVEYAAEASVAPMVVLRRGRWKLILCAADPPLLFDMAADPTRRQNLAADPAHAATLARCCGGGGRWDLAAFDREVRESQARRRVVYEALRQGAYYPVGLPAVPGRRRALHAQPHGSERRRGAPALPPRGVRVPTWDRDQMFDFIIKYQTAWRRLSPLAWSKSMTLPGFQPKRTLSSMPWRLRPEAVACSIVSPTRSVRIRSTP